jgi:uncharacterized membrane protein
MSRGRLEAFSDGVFAVAITLLALNLAVQGPGHGPLLEQLGRHWPIFIAYLISFFTVGIIWVNHHALIANVARVDRPLLFLNLLSLLFVVAIPFGTDTMAQYLTEGGQDSHIAMALYCLILEGMALGLAAVFAWTLREGGTHQPLPAGMRRRAWAQFSAGILVYLIATGIALLSAPAALIVVALVALYYIFERTPR